MHQAPVFFSQASFRCIGRTVVLMFLLFGTEIYHIHVALMLSRLVLFVL